MMLRIVAITCGPVPVRTAERSAPASGRYPQSNGTSRTPEETDPCRVRENQRVRTRGLNYLFLTDNRIRFP